MAGFQSVTRIHVLICILCVCLTYVFYIQACELVLLRALIKSFSLEICSCAHIVDLCEHVGNTSSHAHTSEYNSSSCYCNACKHKTTQWTLHSQCCHKWRCSSIDRQCTIYYILNIFTVQKRGRKKDWQHVWTWFKSKPHSILLHKSHDRFERRIQYAHINIFRMEFD